MVSQLEERNGGKRVPLDSNMIAWLVPYVSFCRTRFNTGVDGTTPWYRLNGAQYNGLMVEFGEQVMIKVYEDDKKLRSRWRKGFWVGKSELNDVAFIATDAGVVSGRSVHRLPDRPFDIPNLVKMYGCPWDPKKGVEVVVPPPVIGPPLPEAAPAVARQDPPQEGQEESCCAFLAASLS